MRLIDTDHIRIWAMRLDSIAILPTLLHDLVRAVSPKGTFVNFPDGRQIFNEGTDGYVKSPVACHQVPEGISIWELGTTAQYKDKANGDYARRTDFPKGFVASESTFVFVTPHSWPGKNEWADEKRKEGKWKEVLVYDCSDIAGWFAVAETVARDYAPVISSYPADGIQTAKDFWFEWSCRDNGLQLPPSIVTSGREYQLNEIKNFVTGGPNVLAVKASSKDEAIAFIIACAKQFNEEEQAVFFTRSLVIDSDSHFRIMSSKKQAMILISRAEKVEIVHRGPVEGNHVFLPLGGDDTYSGTTITLPQISRDGMIGALKKAGLSEEEAQRLTRESGHSITILKRLLHFPIIKSEWAKPENARMVIPAVLIGKWDGGKEGDKEILSAIAGEEYDKIIENLVQWKGNEVPLIYQIGTSWTLTSPLDAWANLSKFITKKDLQRLEEVCLQVLTTVHPAFDLEPDHRLMASLHGKVSNYSTWLREGLLQSLILVAMYGKELELPVNTTSQLWVDLIIKKLLVNPDRNLWSSLNYVLPQIAEASPESFLSAVERALQQDDREIMGMFEEERGLLSPVNHHAGLLWSLEELAWLTQYLPRTTLILGELSRLDPGGSSSNRPINSLRSIFLPWMPQTLADMNSRIMALELLVKHEPIIAWKVLLSLLPKHHDTSYPTNKTRWRRLSESVTERNVTYEEIWNNHSLIIKLLLSLTEFNETKIAQLVETLDDLSPVDRTEVVRYVISNKDKIKQNDFSIWNESRILLGKHRAHADTDWALSESELEGIESIYKELMPDDIVPKYKWLFDESWPEFPEGYNFSETSHEEQMKKIEKSRIEALKQIFSKNGVAGIEKLANEIKEEWWFGQTAAFVLNEQNDILRFLDEERLLGKNLYLIYGFVNKKEMLYGFEWSSAMFNQLKNKGYSKLALSNFLTPLNQSKQLWDFVDMQDESITKNYWKNFQPLTYGISIEERKFLIEKLLSANRGLTAIREAFQAISDLDNNLVIRMLEAGVKSNENERFPSHEIETIFNELDKRPDIERSSLVILEWKYLSILAGSYTRRTPKILHEELSNNPEFFIEILKLLYKPQNYNEASESLSEDERNSRSFVAQQAHRLLTSWKKLPGTDGNNNIDEIKLRNWVNETRKLALKEDRSQVADIHIGKLFASYPENKVDQWPPDIICEFIELINSPALLQSFENEIWNKRSFSSRGPYEGGDRERNIAQYFKGLAEKINFKWPIVATVFSNLEKKYAQNAIEEDDRAKRDSLEY